MSALDLYLSAADPFALFGLERRFDLDARILDQRVEQITAQVKSLAPAEPAKARQAAEKIVEARRVLANPLSRGDLLLDLHGGAGDPVTDGLPPGFTDRLDMLRGAKSPQALEQERERLTAVAAKLFRALGSADNGVVQRERRRQIRETLNAFLQLDQL